MEQLWESQRKHNLFDIIFPEIVSPTFFSKPEFATTNCMSPRKTCPAEFKLLAPKQVGGKKIYRWLVDKDAKLWFANEGPPSTVTPAHFQMTGQRLGQACCLAAGNITFSEHGSVLLISNKSGDFTPSPSSLIHFFAAVHFGDLSEKFGLEDGIRLELWNTDPKKKGCLEGQISWSDVQTWFEKMSPETKDMLKTKYTPDISGCIRDYRVEGNSGRVIHRPLFKAPSPYPLNRAPKSSIGDETESNDSLKQSI